MEERDYWYLLSTVSSLSPAVVRRLCQLYGSPAQLFREKCLPLPEGRQQLLEETLKNSAALLKQREAWEKGGLFFVFPCDPEYPERLEQIPDPPLCLSGYGRLPGEEPTVGIIGARRCSEYGRSMAEQFSRELARAGVSVISGMAMGIDGFAGRAALQAGGRSYGVLGCGADRCYPASNRDLYEALKQQGGLISEYLPGTEPLAWHFPERNRIISGLSDVLLVIEARKKSGTLITVDQALEQGRPVMALPGRTDDELSRGCNELLRQGAEILLEPEDVLTALGIKVKKAEKPGPLPVPGEELLALLSHEPKHLETLAAESGKSFGELSLLLLELENRGLARAVSSGQYVRG